jgi:TRAP-type C4-dicarboxylate transport system permease small subunit
MGRTNPGCQIKPNPMRKFIDTTIKNALVLLMGLLVLNVVWQVFTRYVLQSPSMFTDELARFLLIWVSLLGAAYCSGKNMHIAIDVLPRYLNAGSRRKLDIATRSLIILFVLTVLVIGGGYLVYITWIYRQITPALRIPMAAVYLIGPLSGLLIMYYKISDILSILRFKPIELNDSPAGN